MNQTDLQSLINDTTELPRRTTLLREDGLRTVLLHLKAGEQIPEHQTRGAITVQCLKGQALFLRGEEAIQLTPALVISVPPGKLHSVSAPEDTLLLVTISEPTQS